MQFSATSIGTFARDILAGAGDATVIAVFERSFYLLCPQGIVAVCDETLGRGPINILAPRLSPRDTVRDGMKGVAAASGISLKGGPAIVTETAAQWSPQPFAAPMSDVIGASVQAINAKVLARLATPEGRLLAQGFAPILLDAPARVPRDQLLVGMDLVVRPLCSAIPEAIRAQHWSNDALEAATFLVGLGPGLTPSGDDVLGGVMLGLAARRAVSLRDQLWDHIVDELDDLTVPVSAMHLTAAAHGMGHEAMHALIDAMLTGVLDDADEKLDAVLAIGATSGIDAVAGLLIGLGA